ncbi:hypothetical protein M6B38_142690 [Iris pallida]|uniref:Secreted protein n=1 Tax=Iris pallida TaxID=29817 RepID=A0AAX6FBI7_IRIPA|nr:hypothetical protein M6B38_142690 [Iris pallida]
MPLSTKLLLVACFYATKLYKIVASRDHKARYAFGWRLVKIVLKILVIQDFLQCDPEAVKIWRSTGGSSAQKTDCAIFCYEGCDVVRSRLPF